MYNCIENILFKSSVERGMSALLLRLPEKEKCPKGILEDLRVFQSKGGFPKNSVWRSHLKHWQGA